MRLRKTLWAGIAIAGLSGIPASAAPTAAQKDEFYALCIGISGDPTLCTCKADAAMTLIDERFMAIVISSMRGAPPPAEEYARYNEYVGLSNQVCKPNY